MKIKTDHSLLLNKIEIGRMQLYPPNFILSRKSPRGFLGFGDWKRTYNNEYVYECGFDVADLNPIVLLKSLLITTNNVDTLKSLNDYTEKLFDHTKDDREGPYLTDLNYGMARFFAMLDLFPIDALKPTMGILLGMLLGGKSNGYGRVWSPSKKRNLSEAELHVARVQMEFHIPKAIKLGKRLARQFKMICLRVEFLDVYFQKKPRGMPNGIPLDVMVKELKNGDSVIHPDDAHELFQAIFVKPNTSHYAKIQCSGCFLQAHLRMSCKVHYRNPDEVIAKQPIPNAPPSHS